MQPDSKVVPITASQPQSIDSQVKARKLLDTCRDLTEKNLKALLQRMLDNADDALFAKADKADNNTEQTEYFDSMRIVRLHRSEIESNFYKNIKSSFSHFWDNKKTDTVDESEFSLDELSLMEETDLEESLAITNLVGKIKSNFGQDIGAIEKRLQFIAPDIEITDDTNPMSPKSICKAFSAATSDLDTDLKIKLIIYKLFDHQLVADIGPLYQAINQEFINAEILPKIKTELRQSTHPNVPQAPTSTVDTSGKDVTLPVGETYTAADSGAFLTNLHQLLSVHRGTVGAGSGGAIGGVPGIATGSGGGAGYASGSALPPSSAPPPTTDQILTALNSIQQHPLSYSEGTAAVVVSQNIRNAMGTQMGVAKGQAVALNSMDNDMVDVIAMMFEYILDDPNLPNSARALIGRLQIPMLKVAILDKSLFASKGHPARKLLNDLADAGLGLDDVSGTESPLYVLIEKIVNRILEEFTDDIALFDELIAELETYQANHVEEEQSQQAITKQEYETREQQELARSWVRETLKDALRDKPMPKAVLKVIMGPWHDVMTHTYLNEGETSTLWKNQLRFIDVLAWSVQPKQLKVERNKLGRIIQHLMDSLRSGLQAIEYPNEKIDRIFDALEPYHHASLFGLPVAQADEDRAPASSSAQRQPATGEQSDAEIDFHIPASDPDDDFSDQTTQIELDVSQLPVGTTPEQLHKQKVNAEIEELEQQMATLEELEAMLEEPVTSLDSDKEGDNIQDTFDKEILEDIVLAGWDIEDHNEIDQPEDEYLDIARHLQAGKWVEFMDDDKKTVRAKLSWKSELLGEYTFTDWKFNVIADKTLQGLAADFRRGSARIIDDVPVLDRALSAVMDGLAKKAS